VPDEFSNGERAYAAGEYAEAVKWYRLAAEQGDAVAQFNLGNMYNNGEGVPQKSAEAVKWYRLAAEQGYAVAQFNLGNMYRIGNGVPENDAEALKLYRLAAEQGDAQAQVNLGFIYDNGRGVPQDGAEVVNKGAISVAPKWVWIVPIMMLVLALLPMPYGEYAEAVKWFWSEGQAGIAWLLGTINYLE
jgi:tetratricopeptide (TPR) repeat protein